MAPMSEFEDVIRKSEHIFVILPSLHDVKDAVAVAKSWRRRCQPFMISALPDGHMPSSLLKVDLLKELVFDSKLLRISLEEPVILKKILRNCEKWEDEANSVLELVESLLNICDIDTPMIDGLIEKIDQLLMTIKSSRAAGLSLGFSFHEIPKLQDACCTLQWCLEALYLCCSETSLEEVEGLLEDFEHLPGTFASSSLRSSLIEGVRWLKKAMEVISMPSNETRCRLSDVEEVLEEAQRTRFSFHLMVGQLVDAIGKHKSWQEQVHVFFNPTLGEHSWSQLLQLKELGISDAFRSPELDTVLSEVEKVEQWLLQCEDIFALSNGDVNPLSTALIKVKHTLDRSLNIYNETNGCKVRGTCVCCCSETEDQILACSQCKDWYHISCLTPALVDKYVQEEYVCPYCVFFENGAILGNAGRSVIHREKHPELKMLRGLLSDANGFHVWIEERDIAAQLVERALACKMCLKEIVDQALDYLDEDLSSITERLKTALKAVAVAGVYDHQGCCDLELALSQNAWKIRVKKLLDGSQKPLIQQIQRLLKEGLQMNIPSDEHFMQKLAGVKNMGMHWADNAKKVALDSGALGLDEVFKLIKEGENLPVHFEKELKLLKDRSVLYCICRKPNDQRAMIACDCCDEWYHLDCINLPLSLPKVYICPACKPITDEFTSPSLLVSQEERSSGAKCEPQTPPQHTKSKTKKPRKSRSNLQRRMMVAMDLSSILKNYSGFDRLLWRNKKPFRRAARKRAQLENLSPFFHTQQ